MYSNMGLILSYSTKVERVEQTSPIKKMFVNLQYKKKHINNYNKYDKKYMHILQYTFVLTPK
jgi:hypothetical protein